MGRARTIFAVLLLAASAVVFAATRHGDSPPVSAVHPAQTGCHEAQPGDRDFYEMAFAFPGRDLGLAGQETVAGVIPHHLLAADLVADFFRNLSGRDYDLVVLVGPNHFVAGEAEVITSAYDWETPYGVLRHDAAAFAALVGSGRAAVDEAVVEVEHAVTAEVAFIKRTFPQATFLPLILKPTVDAAEATALAEAIERATRGRKALVVASVDFSHYKTGPEAERDDKKSVAALTGGDFGSVYGLAVDSPPSIYVLLKYAELKGAAFHLLGNANSATLSGHPDLASTTSYVTGFFVAP